jgi:hypothetical protein
MEKEVVVTCGNIPASVTRDLGKQWRTTGWLHSLGEIRTRSLLDTRRLRPLWSPAGRRVCAIIQNKWNPIYTLTKPTTVSANKSPFNSAVIRGGGGGIKHGMDPLTRKLLIRSFWHGNCWSHAQLTMRVCLHGIVIAESVDALVAPPPYTPI